MKKVNPITARVKAKFAQLTKPTKEFSIGNINQSTEPAIAPSGHIGMVPQKAIPSMAKQTKAKATESKAAASKSESAKVKPIADAKRPVEVIRPGLDEGIKPIKDKLPIGKLPPAFTGKTVKELDAYIKKYRTEKNEQLLKDVYNKELTSIKKVRASKSKPVRSTTTSRGSGSGYSSRSTPKAKTKAKAKAKGKVKTKKEKAAAKDEEKASMAKNYKSGYYGAGKDEEKASMAKNYKSGYYGVGKSKKKKKK